MQNPLNVTNEFGNSCLHTLSYHPGSKPPAFRGCPYLCLHNHVPGGVHWQSFTREKRYKKRDQKWGVPISTPWNESQFCLLDAFNFPYFPGYSLTWPYLKVFIAWGHGGWKEIISHIRSSNHGEPYQALVLSLIILLPCPYVHYQMERLWALFSWPDPDTELPEENWGNNLFDLDHRLLWGTLWFGTDLFWI